MLGPEEGHVWEKAGNSDVGIRKSSGKGTQGGRRRGNQPDHVPRNGVKGHRDTKKVRPGWRWGRQRVRQVWITSN